MTRRLGPVWLFFVVFCSLAAACTATPSPNSESDKTAEADKPAAPTELDLWAGIDPIVPDGTEVVTQLKPADGPPKPKTVGEVIEAPFPAPGEPTPPPEIPEGPLTVQRFGPEGDVEVIDAVRATFSHPMVPLAAVETLRAKDAPLLVEPKLDATPQWLGTRTVALQVEGRIPFSTDYTVTIPKGTKGTDGSELAEDVTWTFSTPTLQLESAYPSNGSTGQGLEPTLSLTFNQAITKTPLLAALSLKGGGTAIELEELPPAELPEGATPQEQWQRDRQLRLKVKRELKPNTSYTLSLPKGVYGEGKKASEPIAISFRTYGPLKLSPGSCYGECYANQGLRLDSTNSISDPKAEEKITVTPKPDDLVIHASWGISISGKLEGNTRYTVEVDPTLTDVHGQQLGKAYKHTFKLGPQPPNLGLLNPGKHPIVLEKGGNATLPLRVSGLTELEVTAKALGRESIDELRRVGWTEDRAWPEATFGVADVEQKLDVKDTLVLPKTLNLDLAKMLGEGRSIGYLNVRSNSYKRYDYDQRLGLREPFVVTDLGVSAVLDHKRGTVMVSRLSTGEPVDGADVFVINRYGAGSSQGRTDSDGLIDITVSNPEAIVATMGDDTTFMWLNNSDLLGRWARFGSSRSDHPRAFFFTDRTPYKPGDTIHLSGILREEKVGPEGTIALWRAGATAKYQVNSPRGMEVTKGELEISEFGTFSVDIETDETHGTGDYRFRLELPNLFSSAKTFYHSIPVETYRTPEFEVKVGREDSTPLVYGDSLKGYVDAHYLHGAPLVGGQASYTIKRSTTGFTPPGDLNAGFTFGKHRPYWLRHRSWPMFRNETTIKTDRGTTDNRGRVVFEQTVEPPSPATPVKAGEEPPVPEAATFSVEANVTDENHQSIAASGSYVVHPAKIYVGLRADRSVLRAGEVLSAEAIVVDLEGERVADTSFEVDVFRRVTERKAVEKDGNWQFEYNTEEVSAGECSLTSSADPQPCTATLAEAGAYIVRGRAKDAEGHQAQTELEVYVHGEDAVVWDQQGRRVDLIPDRSSYEPGETANILVRSPFDEARGFVVVERQGIAKKWPIEVKGGATALEVPIESSMMPGVTLSALLVRGRAEIEGAPAGQDLGIPAAAAGEVKLQVSTASKTIDVAVDLAQDVIAPKGKLSVDLKTSVEGQAVSSAVAVFVVDEGVLSLMGYETPDPLNFFIHERPGDVWLDALHRHVMPQTPGSGDDEPAPEPELQRVITEEDGAADDMEAEKSESRPRKKAKRATSSRPKPAPAPSAAPGAFGAGGLGLRGSGKGGGGAGEGSIGLGAMGLVADKAMTQPVSLRTEFATTAFFKAEVRTDDQGQAHLDIDMPENLTTFRVMAVAVDPKVPDRFGHGENAVRVRKPIMVRPSMPRFANFGDSFQGSVMVDNQTEHDQQVLVGVRGYNVELEEADQKLLEIPAGESKAVTFGMKAMAVGEMKLQFAALSNEGRDATQLSLPVLYPAVAEAFADYGMTEDAVQRTIEPPKNALPAYGGLELSFSSTALNGLEDAVQYLVDYRYECAEQTASRILPIFVLGDILKEFPISTMRDEWRRNALANGGIEKLVAKQHHTGGFTYWGSGDAWPYLTNWVTFSLLEGKKAGYEVDDAVLQRALNYLENFVRHGHKTRWGIYYDWTSRAFSLWLLSREGRGESLFDSVWAHRSDMPLYARALLMSAAHRYGKTEPRDQVLDELRGLVIEGAKTIHFAESTSEAASNGLRVLMHSNVQTDAIVLMAMLEVAPDDPILPKVMAGIMAARDPREGGRWSTTHANAWALLAASRYYETLEGDEPDFMARIWLDGEFSGALPFKGRSMAKVKQEVPMAKLVGADQRKLVIGKEGPGKLYYRLGLKYAPADLKLDAVDRGFVAYREYEALGFGDEAPDPDAVKRLDDGSWRVKVGTNIKVTVHVVARDRNNYVVIDDPLPAGFEGQNERFKTSVGTGSSGSTSTPVAYGRGRSRWWWPWWSFSHTDLRDDRMLLFADDLPAGVYTYTYTARATTVGSFILPPTKAEAMYEPEVFGHSASSRVEVVAGQ